MDLKSYQVADFVEKRRANLRKRMRREKLPALLVTSEHNVSYLTGFTGDASYLLIVGDQEFLISDSRYSEQLAEECPEIETVIRTAKTTMMDSISKLVRKLGVSVCGVESKSITKATYDQLCSEVSGEWVGTSGWVEDLRSIKDRYELATIEESIHINQRAFRAVVAELTPEHTERQIAHDLEHKMRAFGASHVAFDPIVGVGSRGALPHAKLTEKRVGEADFVLIDWGAKVSGYASDLTRVLVTSKKIPAKFRKIYEIVLKAQLAAIEKVRPGASFRDIDSAARNVIENAGYGKYFGHGLGHGIGLQIHEQPFISPIHQGELKTNMVITVEPGIYLPGWGGVRIEDDVLVTADGFRVLSHLPKTLEECVVEIY